MPLSWLGSDMTHLYFLLVLLLGFRGLAIAHETPPPPPPPVLVIQDDSATVKVGRSVRINVLANDTYPADQGFQALLLSAPQNGTLKTLAPGVIEYTPKGVTDAEDSFTYTLGTAPKQPATEAIGTVRITIRTPETTTLVKTGDRIPDAGSAPLLPENAAFRSFSVPGIDDSGAPAFLAVYSGKGSEGLVTGKGIFAGEPLRLVAYTGGPVRKNTPRGELINAKFTALESPLLNSLGDVAFVADAISSTKITETGIWLQQGGGELQQLLSFRYPVSGVPGAKWKAVHSIALTDAGTLPFVATLVPGTGGVTSKTALGLWIASEQGVTRVLQRGKPLTLDRVKRTIKNFAALVSVPGSPGHNRISADGSFPIRITWEDGAQSIVVCDADGKLTPRLSTGDPVPGLPDFQCNRFGFPALNRDGLLAVRVSMTSRTKTVSGKNNEVLVSETASGALSVTAREQASIYRENKRSPHFVRLGEPLSNDVGSVAHIASVVDATAIQNPAAGRLRKALWWGQPSESVHFLQAKSVVFGVPAYWRGFPSMAFPDYSTGHPIFTAVRSEVRTGSYSPEDATRSGLWFGRGAGQSYGLAVTGEMHGRKRVMGVAALEAVPGSPAQRRSYNAAEQVIYRLDFSDRSQAIIRQELP